MAAAYLISTGIGVEEAMALIQQVRPFVKLTGLQMDVLERFAADPEPSETDAASDQLSPGQESFSRRPA